MKRKIKINLSRPRLFDFQNVVSFVGEYKDEFDLKELNKALKMLSVKEPLITSLIELDEERNACLCTDKVEQEIGDIQGDLNDFLKLKKKEGIDFSKKLFEFFVFEKNTLVILSHTVVSDIKSLLILAEELVTYYNKESVSVEPEAIKLFSSENELPKEVNSFVADRVTEVLENDYLLKPVYISDSSYKIAKEKFFSENGETEYKEFLFNRELSETLSDKSKELKVDFSSLVVFALFKALSKNKKQSKKADKVSVYADRRPFFIEKDLYSVGAFNGNVIVELPKKCKNVKDEAKEFHKTLYKKVCSCFDVFYSEYFLSRVSPELLDATFLYKAGQCKNKTVKKLATLYGCEQKFLFSFSSLNLNQLTWGKLSTFNHISVKEPHKSNENLSFSLVMSGENRLFVEYNSTRFSEANIEQIFSEMTEVLKML